ncbi:methyl-accepting chemotaxis protein [Brachyspira hampsonii]|uniref:Methyl-accepting chemotaxis protein McpB n=3 Tax=Brachyspira hampsonii TaxID=1287055 RepID=A0A2U4EXW2_9SPIR|nr:methyl-accepting chemotaxis protein [Brachyspira hampsonii]EKV58176.1 methyl-accepting chemotaxis protein McpB [Brachyspira hampsonii 30446]MBW5390690.1 methyl-accepting chemotaxis protein [Brachyspira hampsonii]OEJ19978.1 chemotaxis protein [Brachyspira hampsonii]
MKKINSLAFRMPFVICIMVVVIIIAMLISSIRIGSKGISDSKLGGFNSTIAGYASVLDTWFGLESSLINTYAVTPVVVRYLEGNETITSELLLSTIKNFKSNNLYIINIGLADVNGNIISDSVSSVLVGRNLKDYIPKTWSKVSANNDEIVYGDILMQSEVTGKWAMPAVKLVKDDNNQNIGYIYVLLDWYILHQTHFSNIDLGETGGLFITSENLYNIMDSKYENIANMQINPIYKQAFSGASSGIITYDLNGDQRTAAYYKMKSRPWIIALAMMDYEIFSQNRKLIIASVIIGIISIIALAIFVSLFIGTITKPLEIVVEEAQEIEKGDLSNIKQRIKPRKDEIGVLSKSFVSMRRKLAETITEVNTASNNIVKAAQELSQGNTDLSRRTESQAASLEETASSMEEMASTIKSSTDHAVEGNNMMLASKEAVENAGKIIAETTINIEEVYEASTKIKNITKIIEDIAFQTNILALNAAVEAARAGDQGKGFAVVASEVRNLAQTTQSSVKDITVLVDNTNEKISKATETARQSQDIFIDIQQKIEDTARIMQDISATAMEQQTGVDQVNKAVAEMDTVTQHNASLVQESANTSESLLAQAHALKDTVSFFKLSADDLMKGNTVKVKKEPKQEIKTENTRKQDFSKKETIKKDISKKELKVPPSIERERAMESQKQDSTTVRNDEFGATYSSTSNEMTDDGFASF